MKKKPRILSSTLIAMNDSCSDDIVIDEIPANEVVITSSAVSRKRKKPIEKPLPDPFPLPENFRPDVQVALKSGKMTTETRRAYLTQVASSIFNHKLFPTREELTRVALDIIKRYPFLQSPAHCGSRTVSRSI